MPITSDDRYLMEKWSKPNKLEGEQLKQLINDIKSDYEVDVKPIFNNMQNALNSVNVNMKNAGKDSLAIKANKIRFEINKLEDEIRKL